MYGGALEVGGWPAEFVHLPGSEDARSSSWRHTGDGIGLLLLLFLFSGLEAAVIVIVIRTEQAGQGVRTRVGAQVLLHAVEAGSSGGGRVCVCVCIRVWVGKCAYKRVRVKLCENALVGG